MAVARQRTAPVVRPGAEARVAPWGPRRPLDRISLTLGPSSSTPSVEHHGSSVEHGTWCDLVNLRRRSLSRPRTSKDNPYSEAAFQTAKYRPDYPGRFDILAQGQTWMRHFVGWYNPSTPGWPNCTRPRWFASTRSIAITARPTNGSWPMSRKCRW